MLQSLKVRQLSCPPEAHGTECPICGPLTSVIIFVTFRHFSKAHTNEHTSFFSGWGEK